MSPFGLFGSPNVEKLKTQNDVKGLLEALNYQKNAKVRQDAAQALGQVGDANVIEPLIAALKDSSIDVRQRATEALLAIGVPAVEPLIAALKDSKWQVRRGAAEILGKISDARAVGSLITALNDSDREVSQQVKEALVAIGVPAVEPLIAVLKDSIRYMRQQITEALVAIGVPAIEPLIATLKDNDNGVRREAAEALGKIGWQPTGEAGVWYWIALSNYVKCAEIGTPAIEPLAAALKDQSWLVRRDAVVALGKIGDSHAIEALATALRDSDKNVREQATEALEKLGVPIIEPLIAGLRDSNGNVRRGSAELLGKMGWQPADEAGAWYWLALSNYEKCIEVGTPAVEPLIAALKENESDARQRAAKALITIGIPAVEPLTRALKDSDTIVRGVATWTLAGIHDVGAIEPLIDTLNDKDSKVRRMAAYALGEFGDARAAESLVAALKDEVGDNVHGMRIEVAVALGKIGDPRAIELFLDALTDEEGIAYEEEMDKVRSLAITAMERLGPSAVEALIPALDGKHHEAGRMAAEALGKIGDPRAIGALVAAQKNSNRDVQQVAAEALKKLGYTAPMKYFEAPRGPFFQGVCSDRNCPCPETKISWGEGYLFIRQETVDFRLDAPTQKELEKKVERLRQGSGFDLIHMDQAAMYPILVCERGAKLRNLDLETAAADAKHWWKTELAPLRATPLASTRRTR